MAEVAAVARRQPWYTVLYIQVLIAITLGNLIALILTFYGTSILFVVAVLGTIAHWAGFSIFRFVAYIKDELLIVLGTSSSETVLPHMIHKMERLGASKSVVGLVIPTGYSFNLDGTNIYMTLAILFGIDKFMSECRALTNLVGNGVATVVVSRWECELDRAKLNAALENPVELGEETRRQAA